VAWIGLTDNYLRVQVMADGGAGLTNRITPARLVSLNGTALAAELVPGASDGTANRP
jgi:hypothetical protein